MCVTAARIEERGQEDIGIQRQGLACTMASKVLGAREAPCKNTPTYQETKEDSSGLDRSDTEETDT